MPDPLVSVVTPSYEQADFLEETLESVRTQSGAAVEHVVVDGGSTDGSIEILEAYEDRYDLRWVSEPDDGQSDAVNKGVEMARGEWICWLNSDDYLLPGAIDTVATAAREHPDSDVIYGDFLFVDADGNEVGRKYNSRPSTFVHKHYYQFTGNHSTFIRRDLWNDIGGLDESLDYTMDTDLFWRLLQADPEMTRVKEFLGARRLHDAAKTTGEPPEARREEMEHLRTALTRGSIERFVPRRLLVILAAGLQVSYHLLDGRPQAVRYMAR